MFEVSRTFHSKNSCSNREYDYYLPTFCLQRRVLTEVQEKQSESKEDAPELDLSHYEYRISNDEIERVTELCTFFQGTHKFHNYTKNVLSKEPNAKRYILSMKITKKIEIEGIEFLHFSLVGQSFLYNQIRKMIGTLYISKT